VYWSISSDLSAKLKRGTITDRELVMITDKLNITFEQLFTLLNDEKIAIKMEVLIMSLSSNTQQ
jgi:hypothetical protein